MIAQRLFNDERTVRSENKYLKWIENYVADDFQEAVRRGRGKLVSSPGQGAMKLTLQRLGRETCAGTITAPY